MFKQSRDITWEEINRKLFYWITGKLLKYSCRVEKKRLILRLPIGISNEMYRDLLTVIKHWKPFMAAVGEK